MEVSPEPQEAGAARRVAGCCAAWRTGCRVYVRWPSVPLFTPCSLYLCLVLPACLGNGTAKKKREQVADVKLHTLGLWEGSRLMVNKAKVDVVKEGADAKVPNVKIKHIVLGDIKDVVRGKESPVFQANPKADDVSSKLCVSLITDARSLDLQLPSSVIRETFALAIETVVEAVGGRLTQ